MLTVYAIPLSLYCAKLRILLRRKGLAWQEVPPPGGYGSEAYKQVVASGNLPALKDGDLLLADSEAIAEYLNDVYPDPPMWPDAPALRAKARELSRFHDTRLEPELRKLFPEMSAATPNRDLVDAQGQALSSRLGQLGRMLEAAPDFGLPLTQADCGYPITFAWIDAFGPVMGLTVDWPAAVLAYRQRIEGQVDVAAELASYRPIMAERFGG